jgi:hypothetical protein
VVPAISPDGARIAVGFNREILIFEAGEGKVAQIISGNPLPPPFLGGNLAWSPDGRRIAYISNQASGAGVYIRPSDGSGKAELLSSTQATNLLWSAERFLTLNPRDSRGPFAILPIEGDMKSIDIKGSFDVSPRLSPDGRFIAWSALSTTPNEVDIYVRPFESSAADTVSDNVRWRIATGAREVYRWRADGKELYYLSNNGGVMAVPITTSPEFKAGPPQLLFQAPQGILAPATGAQNVDLRMDISRNGQRFVFVLPPTADTSTRASARGVPSPSQSDGIGGSWQIAPGGPTFYLITDGTTLVGTMRKTEDRTTFSWPIFEGKVDGTTITFKVGASGMLTGKLNGNEISLSGDVQLPPGDPAIPIAGGSLNMRAVLEGILSRLPFVARRVQ